MNELLKKHLTPYVFVKYDTSLGDVYYCGCGGITKFKNEETKELSQELTDTANQLTVMSDDSDFQEEFKNIYKGMKMGFDEVMCCSFCFKNFKESNNANLLISDNSPFISNIEFVEDDTSLILKYIVISPNLESNEKVDFQEKVRYLKFEKDSKKLIYKGYEGGEVEFDLDEVVKYVNLFFVFDTAKVVNIMEMHLFVGRLANFIMDSKNIDIIKELLENLRGQAGYAGLDIIRKIASIFMGIIKYSNLSTIAMTKGAVFLYDLMSECNIPKPEILTENQATSPIRIFNFLVQNHNKLINVEVNADNKKVHDFKFKSTKRINFDETSGEVNIEDLTEEQEVNISFNTGDSFGKVKIDSKGDYKVDDTIEDSSVSKFVFNKIEKFHDYRKIIRYLKHVSKQELIQLLQKYEIGFLSEAIDLIYFRNQVPFKEFERILDIMLDYVRLQSKKHCDVMDGVVRMNYELLRKFEFILFDDALMMIEVLRFDPRVHFNKIRTYDALEKYHNDLVRFFSVLRDEEKNGGILSFTTQFKMLESKENYNGPLEFKLLSTPAMIIKEGVEMRHSASAYARNVAQGNYLMGQIYDNDPGRMMSEPQRFTIGFNFNKYTGLEFEQVKGFANETGPGIPKKTDRFKKLMMEWLTAKDISFRPIGDLKLSEEIRGEQNEDN